MDIDFSTQILPQNKTTVVLMQPLLLRNSLRKLSIKQKAQLRRKMSKSPNLSQESIDSQQKQIFNNFLEHFFLDSSGSSPHPPKKLFLYRGMTSWGELNTLDLIETITTSHKECSVYLPVLLDMRDHQMNFYSLESFSKQDLLKNPLTVKPAARSVPETQCDICIVPGIAFTMDGKRLGRGGGYYDVFFSPKNKRKNNSSCTLISFAMDHQITKDLPLELHDIFVDYLVTSKGIIDCSQNRPKDNGLSKT